MRRKRIIAFAAAMAAILCSISMFPVGPVYADEPEETGCWEFVESWDNVSESLKREGYGYMTAPAVRGRPEKRHSHSARCPAPNWLRRKSLPLRLR